MGASPWPVCCRDESSFWVKVLLFLTAQVLGSLKHPADYPEQDLCTADWLNGLFIQFAC